MLAFKLVKSHGLTIASSSAGGGGGSATTSVIAKGGAGVLTAAEDGALNDVTGALTLADRLD